MAIINNLPIGGSGDDGSKSFNSIDIRIVSGYEFVRWAKVQQTSSSSATSRNTYIDKNANYNSSADRIWYGLDLGDNDSAMSVGDSVVCKIIFNNTIVSPGSALSLSIGINRSYSATGSSISSGSYAYAPAEGLIPEGTIYYVKFEKTASRTYSITAYDSSMSQIGAVVSVTSNTHPFFCPLLHGNLVANI